MEIIERNRTRTVFDKDTGIEFEFSNKNIEELILFSKSAISKFNYVTEETDVMVNVGKSS